MKKLLLLSFLFIGCQNISNEIIVDPDVEDMYLRYNKAWSDGDFETITNEIYSVPFSLYLQDSTVILNSSEDIKSFLIMTFNELENNNYGYSIRNSWESYKIDDNLVIVEQNFTRFFSKRKMTLFFWLFLLLSLSRHCLRWVFFSSAKGNF